MLGDRQISPQMSKAECVVRKKEGARPPRFRGRILIGDDPYAWDFALERNQALAAFLDNPTPDRRMVH
jgi:hypothetical protein